MAEEECNRWIENRICKNIPTAICRFGAVELNMLRKIEYCKIFAKKPKNYEEVAEQIKICAGFFKNDEESLNEFHRLMVALLPETDLLGEWNLPMEEYFINKYMLDTKLTRLGYLDSWGRDQCWTRALKGKRVVVIHPFADTIVKQYANREKIWKNGDILPEFELRVVKAVQTIAGEKDERFVTWFDALEYMYNETVREEFDVALIGCGAYGMPLALKLKRNGNIAIHIGGGLQLLFGIKGKRWENCSFYNEFWVFPNEEETPQYANRVENGCYL